MKGGEVYPGAPLLAPQPPVAKVMCSLCIEEYSGYAPYPGPATVRMVSSNGPPVPMPMQVPPGHMVQQIVDENGILTHVILSPQPLPGAPLTGGPSNATQYYPAPYAHHYPSAPPQYPSHHHPHPHTAPHSVHPHIHSGMPHIPSAPSHACTNHIPGHPGASPPLNSPEDRNIRQRNKVRKRLQQRRTPENFYTQQTRPPGRQRRGGVNGEVAHGNGGHGGSHMIVENGPVEPEDNSLIIQNLSSMLPPKVTDIEARSALIQLTPPDCDVPDMEMDVADCKYELLLSDKGRDAKYKAVFCGDATEITLKDLKPAVEYHLKACALLSEELKGVYTDPVSFRTTMCEPDRPQPPKLSSKTKTSLSLKWNSTCENGSKISTYSLEYDQGLGDNSFVEIYNGLSRTYRANRLNASTRYLFRLAAINGVGKSLWSEPAAFFTSGSVPSQPDPPMLSEQLITSLTLSWIKRPNDDEFLLQMEDEEATGHGFMPVYNGPNLSYSIHNLRRNTEYKFRLSAKNDEGQSKWSDVVNFKTLPGRPAAPNKPQIKGKVQAHSFRITWEPPTDDGGAEITKYFVELDDGQGYETVYEGSEREHQFEQLTPGHTYRVRVACCSSGGRSDFSDCCVTTTQPVPPGQCQAPKLQGKPKATSLHLRWAYPDYDGGSTVTAFAAQMISPDNSTREVYKGHDLDCIVAGLLPGRPYLFQVRAYNRAGAGPWSELLEVVSGAGAPYAPKSVQVVCRSPHSAVVMWDEPVNNGAAISEYRLEWTQRPDFQDFIQLYVGPNLNYEAKGLMPATTYTFRVQAVNSAGTGPHSPATSCTTPPSSPGMVMSLRCQPGPTWVQLWWRSPPCNGSEIISYNVYISDKQPITVEPVTEYILEGLQPETSYKIRIQAVNSIGVGPFSTPTKVTTRALPPSPPRLECLSVAPNSLKLKWGDGRNPDMVQYTLEMEKEDGSFQAVYSGPAHTHKVNRLAEMTNYEFRIFASNDAGHGPYSDTVTFSTTKAPPPAPKAPRVHQLQQRSCEVEWQGCKAQGSDPVVYILQLQKPYSTDHEYRQIYRGPNTHFSLDGLEPSTEYQVRVCAVRESCDGSAMDILGPFSPGTHFTTCAIEPPRKTPVQELDHRSSEPRQWTDQQWAAVIVICFVVLAILLAFVVNQVMTYMGYSTSVSASTSSPSPPKTN